MIGAWLTGERRNKARHCADTFESRKLVLRRGNLTSTTYD
jgi:hypothetical protein